MERKMRKQKGSIRHILKKKNFIKLMKAEVLGNYFYQKWVEKKGRDD